MDVRMADPRGIIMLGPGTGVWGPDGSNGGGTFGYKRGNEGSPGRAGAAAGRPAGADVGIKDAPLNYHSLK